MYKHVYTCMYNIVAKDGFLKFHRERFSKPSLYLPLSLSLSLKEALSVEKEVQCGKG